MVAIQRFRSLSTATDSNCLLYTSFGPSFTFRGLNIGSLKNVLTLSIDGGFTRYWSNGNTYTHTVSYTHLDVYKRQDGHMLNTNADTIAGETAKALAGLFDVTLVFCCQAGRRRSCYHFLLANIISEISKKVNNDFRKASRGIAPACALTMDEVFHGSVHVLQLAKSLHRQQRKSHRAD